MVPPYTTANRSSWTNCSRYTENSVVTRRAGDGAHSGICKSQRPLRISSADDTVNAPPSSKFKSVTTPSFTSLHAHKQNDGSKVYQVQSLLTQDKHVIPLQGFQGLQCVK